jgi:hypothetical protein
VRVRRAAVLGALAVLLATGLGAAHASTLTVDGSALQVRTAGACSAATVGLSARPNDFLSWLFGYTQVQVDVPTGCAGTAVSVTIYATSGGAVLATASATDVAAGTVTLTTSATYGGVLGGRPAYSGAVTFDGWSVPASF